MAEAAAQKSPAEQKAPVAASKKAPKAPKARKSGGLRPDLSTILGIALALSGTIGGLVLEKGSVQDIMQGTAALIVFGGTMGAVMVTNPLSVVLGAFKGLIHVFMEQTASAGETIETLIGYATKARKNGIVSLESEGANIPDPFMRKALNLAVDGTDLQELRNMMEVDMALAEQSAEAEAKVWEGAGGFAPTVGIIGAVMGLIQVMKHLEDIKEVGHGIAVAFVATVYGVGSANFFFLPAANKLRARMRQTALMKEMVLEGIIGIVEGLNPTLIRLKLEAYNLDPAKPKPKKKGKPEAVPAAGKAPAGQAAPAGGRP
jgi:chemotaxis protein MotA